MLGGGFIEVLAVQVADEAKDVSDSCGAVSAAQGVGLW